MKTLITGVVTSMLLTGNAFSGTWIVSTKGKADFNNIQGAINAASNGDEVLVMPGYYNEQINFQGKGITILSNNGPQDTVIDGNGAGSVVSFTSGEPAEATLQGFTVTGGTGTWIPNVDGAVDIAGGGILVMNSSATIVDCNIQENFLYTQPNYGVYNNAAGAGVYVENGTLLLDACLINENTATGTHAQSSYTYAFIVGAGVGSLDSTLTMRDCEVTNNTGSTTATNPAWIHSGIYGVGVSVRGGNASIEHCHIGSNHGSVRSLGTVGSGVFLFGVGVASIHEASVTVSNSTIENNTGYIENTQTYYDQHSWSYGTGISVGIGGWAAMAGGANLEVIDSIITGNSTELVTPNSLPHAGGAGLAAFTDQSNYEINMSVQGSQVCGNTPEQVYGQYSDGGGNTIDEDCLEQTELHVPSQYPTIADAINNAVSGDTILIAAGQYHEHGLVVDEAITITTASGERDVVIHGDDAGRIMTIQSVGEPGLSLANIWFTHGNAPHSNSEGGGAVLIDNALATIDNCEFSSNSAWFGAGIGTRNNSVVQIVNSYFHDSGYNEWSSALALDGTVATVQDCLFENNESGLAGAMSVHSVTADQPVQIINCRFSGNAATGGWPYGRGGALYVAPTDALITIDGCLFENNTATGDHHTIFMDDYAPVFPPLILNTILCPGAGSIDGPWDDGGNNTFVEDCYADCNDNGVDDVLDIWDGTSQDSNNDGVLDECECFSDVNGDGTGNVLDILMLLENWGQTGPIGDTTNDGIVNVDDIMYIIDNWGACT
jgi:hypothetical protein